MEMKYGVMWHLTPYQCTLFATANCTIGSFKPNMIIMSLDHFLSLSCSPHIAVTLELSVVHKIPIRGTESRLMKGYSYSCFSMLFYCDWDVCKSSSTLLCVPQLCNVILYFIIWHNVMLCSYIAYVVTIIFKKYCNACG